jgi:hypothetical protein
VTTIQRSLMKWRSDATNVNPSPRQGELAAGVQAGLRRAHATSNPGLHRISGRLGVG